MHLPGIRLREGSQQRRSFACRDWSLVGVYSDHRSGLQLGRLENDQALDAIDAYLEFGSVAVGCSISETRSICLSGLSGSTDVERSYRA
jgi:hypothetical protein